MVKAISVSDHEKDVMHNIVPKCMLITLHLQAVLSR